MYSIDTGSLTADAWTKVIKTIPGNSNLTFDNDANEGLHIRFLPFFGTDYTNNSVTEDAWAAYSSSTRTKDNTSTWYTTNDATFELTGVQLEVGPQATAFEHRSMNEELALCKRYYEIMGNGASQYMGNGWFYSNSAFYCVIRWEVQKRAVPSIDQVTGSSYYVVYHTQQADVFDGFSGTSWINVRGGAFYNSSQVSGTSGNCGGLGCNNASAFFAVEAEL